MRKACAMSAAYELPSCNAWLGVRDGLARICAWCPDKAVADLHGLNLGLKLSHGLCPSCLQSQLGGLVIRLPAGATVA